MHGILYPHINQNINTLSKFAFYANVKTWNYTYMYAQINNCE